MSLWSICSNDPALVVYTAQDVVLPVEEMSLQMFVYFTQFKCPWDQLPCLLTSLGKHQNQLCQALAVESTTGAPVTTETGKVSSLTL